MERDGELKADKFNPTSNKGNFKAGKLSGKGKAVFKSGAKYDGDPENDQKSGCGTNTYSKETSIDYYEGHWSKSERSGKGKLVWKDGSNYEGDFENDRINGFGVQTYSKEDNKDYYEGHWTDDKKTGKGKFVFKNEAKYEGDFENDLFNGEGTFTYSKAEATDYYEGHWKDGKRSGKGKLVFKNGSKFEGEFENDRPIYTKVGVYTFPAEDSRDCYEGRWLDGKRSGKGKLVFKDGSEYEGRFENDLPVYTGFGTYTFPKEDSRDYYKGLWMDGKKSGRGKLAFKNGIVQEGTFENGVFKEF